jgi:hypothetical protein
VPCRQFSPCTRSTKIPPHCRVDDDGNDSTVETEPGVR